MPISVRSVSFATLRQHRWFRPAVRALAGLIALWLITWLAIPPLVKARWSASRPSNWAVP